MMGLTVKLKYLFRFRTLSFFILIGFLLVGCKYDASVGECGVTPISNVSGNIITFLNTDLDTIDFTTESSDTVNIIDMAKSFGITSAYEANSDVNIINDLTYEKYNLTQNVNFYTSPNLDVKEIRTQKELNDIRNDLKGKYVLLDDIELDEAKGGFDTDGWIPINSFRGIFSGNNHKITNLWINRPTAEGVGFFSDIIYAHIKDLGVEIAEGKEIIGKNYIGAIAGKARYGYIKNSYSTGNIRGEGDSSSTIVGGIAGYISDSDIINSCSAGNISGNNYALRDYVGGIAGQTSFHINITNSYSTGNISGYNYVGGIAGSGGGNIGNSYSAGNIIGHDNIGGIAGYWESGYITNSYSTGNISGIMEVGGIAGSVRYAHIKSSYSTGNISGIVNVGKIIGSAFMGTCISNYCFFL
ncbi:MAG: hypothetical protein LBF13_07420 [Campylobacteraceae bacterium]|jgi:hypothetical protein|nr:hypothetical protein [Campylobacteraceae bacterium]